jgi:hypothetical protein
MCHCRRRWLRVWIEFFADLAMTSRLLNAEYHAEVKEQTYLLFLTNVSSPWTTTFKTASRNWASNCLRR